jgi:hypothetical protein
VNDMSRLLRRSPGFRARGPRHASKSYHTWPRRPSRTTLGRAALRGASTVRQRSARRQGNQRAAECVVERRVPHFRVRGESPPSSFGHSEREDAETCITNAPRRRREPAHEVARRIDRIALLPPPDVARC